jgi:hypothetical protein
MPQLLRKQCHKTSTNFWLWFGAAVVMVSVQEVPPVAVVVAVLQWGLLM